MEIIKNRYGVDRVIEKIDSTRIRIMGDSLYSRGSEDAEGNHTMFDFEGGPCLTVGGTISYAKIKWKIDSIKIENTGRENFSSVVVGVK
jgi:hypothetical protein